MTSTTSAEAVQFWILGTVAVIAALGVVVARKAVYSALFLATTMIILALFYIAQGAVFLGVVQIVVYTGAVMMLFLFVLMLVGVDSADSLVESLRGQRIGASVIGIGFGLLLIGGLGNASMSGFVGFSGTGGADGASAGGADPGNIHALADLIFVRYVWAFELTGALLITATLGAMLLAHHEKIEAPSTQRELSEQRFRYLSSDEDNPESGSATPHPSPGVYARHNAVDMPARLPDGSLAARSVSSSLTPRSMQAPPTDHSEDER